MVTSPDYVYGIIPDLGEYGFERQPSVVNDPALSRVQSLAGSFQWAGNAQETGADTSNPIAIAVDRGSPNLIARFATDPGDPDGRLSLRMHVWTCDGSRELTDMLQANWPVEHSLPITLQSFTRAVTGQTVGRWVAGPTDQFDAVDFTQNWGGRSCKPQSTTTRRPNAVSRKAKQQRATSSSSTWPKLLASLMALVAIGSIGAAAKIYWDFEKASTAAAQTKNDLHDAEEKLSGVIADLASANQRIRQNEIEIRKQERLIEEGRATIAKREAELAKQDERLDLLNEIIEAKPGKVDQKELADLRLLKTAVEKYVTGSSSALEQLKDAIPGQPSVLETIKSKIQDVGNGKANNE